jgi:hypothetical protein
MIFLDMDGVLADFNKHAINIFGMLPEEYQRIYGPSEFWNKLRTDPNFFANLEPLPDAMDLFNGVKHLPHAILTGIPKDEKNDSKQKIDWAHKFIDKDINVICCLRSKKFTFCKPGDILIDDIPSYSKKWENAGGIFIHHTSAANTLKTLKEMRLI